MIDIVLDTPYTLDKPTNKLPAPALSETIDWLKANKLGLVAGWLWARQHEDRWHIWKATKADGYEETGTWPKRFAAALYKEANHKLDDNLISILGEKMSSYKLVADKPTTIVFSKTIDWKPGSFGDSGSCWWRPSYSMNKARRVFNAHPNTMAIKIYTSKDDYEKDPTKGEGRCFSERFDDKLALFNVRCAYFNIRTFSTLAKEILQTNARTGYVTLDSPYYTDGDGAILGDSEDLPNTFRLKFMDGE